MRTTVAVFLTRLHAGDLRAAVDRCCDREADLDLEDSSSYLVMGDGKIREIVKWSDWIGSYPSASDGKARLAVGGETTLTIFVQQADPRYSFYRDRTVVSISSGDDETLDRIETIFSKYAGCHISNKEVNEPANPRSSPFVGPNTSPSSEDKPKKLTVMLWDRADTPELRELGDYLRQFSVELVTPREAHQLGSLSHEVFAESVRRSDVAFVILSAADEMKDGTQVADELVVYQLGVMQSALGSTKAIVLLEIGVRQPSTLFGLELLKFRTGHISDTYRPILEFLRRQFSSSFSLAGEGSGFDIL